MPLLQDVTRRLERLRALDTVAKPLIKVAARAVQPRAVRNLLSGTNLGHPLHPMLTDVPIGAWTMSTLLDNVGGRAAEPAADLLVGTGIVAAVPTAASGLNDWSDTMGGETRIGLVHAGANVAALSLYTASLIARRRGNRGRGRLLGLAGFGTLLAGGYLGGHLSFVKALNVNHTAFEHRPGEWTPVLGDSELGDGEPRRVLAGEASVLLYRQDGRLYALADTCSHLGGPLHQGTITDGCVTCPWHGSTFRMADGTIVRGPASSPQPVYSIRVNEGRIEVRAES